MNVRRKLFVFKQKREDEVSAWLVGSEMCMIDRHSTQQHTAQSTQQHTAHSTQQHTAAHSSTQHTAHSSTQHTAHSTQLTHTAVQIPKNTAS